MSKKSVSWTSKFVTMVLQENGRRSDVTFVVQTFWTPPNKKRGKTEERLQPEEAEEETGEGDKRTPRSRQRRMRRSDDTGTLLQEDFTSSFLFLVITGTVSLR